MRTRSHFFPPLVPLILLALLVSGCDRQDPASADQSQPLPKAKVQVIEPAAHMLTEDLPGRIEPARTAEVRARVPGIVLERLFEEGADVKAGDVLFRIDPAPLEAAVAQARGELARAEASIYQANSLVRRYEPLAAARAISQQEYDNAIAAQKSAEAEKLSAQAALETARLNLEYATVRAPIAGRIGRALVTEGALVGQGEATPMARIQQLDPIYADFTQSVDDLLRLRAAAAEGRIEVQEDGAARVRITLGEDGYSQEGRLLFSDVSVEPSTGQVTLRAQLPNPDAVLLPGMYVRVQTELGVEPDAVFIPQRAIRRGTDSIPRVLVVDQEGTVQQRTVELGSMHGSDWRVVSGLEQGERVIVDGVAAFQPGSKVEPVIATPSQGE
ncbi:multidrug resistance protein [Pseudomonas saudimassiliensis]|uniref:Multidrug resistance protein n=1 Tax=Pseudomonas saudimassiliensis TaxID=1461581 RepID=A0A078M368_9PSED|nr:efflux RND transporter periplasmic adaptor subunit [Pseudomonas saudimassiliensis]CEA02033.1 multidrug resistance protein [Pseudomonas saudimassiliensis]CEF25704.1 multidrug resistance protein [Pseudomonas saudimassiliensis]